MAQWKDKAGGTHRLEINGQIAKRMRSDLKIDVLQCLVKTEQVTPVLQQLADNPELIMATCACIEGIPDGSLNAYYDLWDGDTFDAASMALFEAIADFFPKRPRAILQAVMQKMRTASETVSVNAQELAMKRIGEMDLISVLSESLTRGSGGTASAESSAMAASN